MFLSVQLFLWPLVLYEMTWCAHQMALHTTAIFSMTSLKSASQPCQPLGFRVAQGGPSELLLKLT